MARELRRCGIEAEERRVPWRRAAREEVDALTGQNRVPLLVIGREAICDSRRIVEHLRRRDAGGQPLSGYAPALSFARSPIVGRVNAARRARRRRRRAS